MVDYHYILQTGGENGAFDVQGILHSTDLPHLRLSLLPPAFLAPWRLCRLGHLQIQTLR